MRTNELIDRVNQHNDSCYRVWEALCDAIDNDANKSKIECYMTMREGNYETGIEYCCLLRVAGLNAVVDRITGAVVSEDTVEMKEVVMEDGKPRYLTFCFADYLTL